MDRRGGQKGTDTNAGQFLSAAQDADTVLPHSTPTVVMPFLVHRESGGSQTE